MQHGHAQEQPQSGQLEMSLREHLLAAGGQTPGQAPSPYPPSATQPVTPYHHHNPQDSSPHDHQNIDPNVTGEGMSYAMGADGDDGMSPDARNKGKRELSTSKRAAQNRAAQRAFRQRKEGYIKKLEEQVKEFQTMENNYKAIQNENYQLREYILNLQARLLENQSEFPPPPSHINLSATAPPPSGPGYTNDSAEQQLRREMQQQQHHPPPAPVTAREDPLRHDGISQLQAAAAASGGEPHPHASAYPPPPEPYPQHKRQRPDEPRAGAPDVKPPA